MIRKRLRNRFGIAARRVAVRPHLSWPWRAASLCMLIALGMAIILGIWRYGAEHGLADFGASDANDSRMRITALRNALAQARQMTATNDSQLRIEVAMREKLVAELKKLEEENTRLKADLAVFENLAGGRETNDGLAMSQLQVVPSATAGEYHYRLMLVQGGARREEQKGKLQFIATVQQGGKIDTLRFVFAGDGETPSGEVAFRNFRRLEGTFTIASGSHLKSLEARFIKDGMVKASQTAIF